ncbi:uncharacterized protein EDB91DRAFT_1123131, partial [Suillus paluster]|uniref:uncharacterized protein n=1 Tax=Suillus paluster TaxID=48578 RepID=UPI001B886D3F
MLSNPPAWLGDQCLGHCINLCVVLSAASATSISSASEQQHHHSHPGYMSLPWSAAHAHPPFYPQDALHELEHYAC